MATFDKIIELLDKNNILYSIKNHPPTRTSEEAALHRGEPLKIGAKALIIKGKDQFYLTVIPADRKLDTKKLKKILQSKSLRFATEEELKELTDLVPGSVPPFGNLLNLPMLVDKTLLEEEYMAFNAGSLTTSIKMKVKDYVRLLSPQFAEFSFL
ncbi:hypothetical protein J4421_02005 [Candidatus Woesearchaeota archaeon]|nr:hypothetical protein [Candidatus Woesearchaeota archaeon]